MLLLAGCSGSDQPPKKDSQNEPEPSQPEVKKDVYAGGSTTVEITREDGTVAWSVTAESSRVAITSDGNEEFFLKGVSGVLRDEKGDASKFTADTATANAKKRTISANRARITSLRRDVTMEADGMKWLDDKRLIAVEGNVWLRGKDWELGPSEVLWATPDLTKVGTPDQF